MAYNPEAVVTMEVMKTAMNRVKTEIVKEVNESGHLKREKVDVLPDVATAEEGVQYLIKNEKTGHYDVYELIDGKLEWVDDTTVDLEGYVTQEELEEALKNAGTSGDAATEEEVAEMLDEVFGATEEPTV